MVSLFLFFAITTFMISHFEHLPNLVTMATLDNNEDSFILLSCNKNKHKKFVSHYLHKIL